jgi:hypothetical protein
MGKDLVQAAEARFERIFAKCREDIDNALDEMAQKQNVAGLLRSGSTITQAARLFEEHSLRALHVCTSDIGKHVEDRGKRWRRMLASLRVALDAHIEQAPSLLSKTVSIVGSDGPRLLAPLLENTAIHLRQNFAEFEAGWTAPRAKPWRERHPITYALLMAGAGAVVGAASKDLLVWSFQQLKAAVELAPRLFG